MGLVKKLKEKRLNELLDLKVDENLANRVVENAYSTKGMIFLYPLEIKTAIYQRKKNHYTQEELYSYLNLFK